MVISTDAAPKTVKSITKSNIGLCIYVLLASLSIIFFIAIYIRDEHPLYLWDYGYFYEKYQSLVEGLVLGTDDIITSMASSIRNDDYNYSSLIALLLPGAILGTDRLTYVLLLAATYTIPASILALMITRRSVARQGYGAIFAMATLCMLFTPIWGSTFRGMPDIAGLVPIGIVSLLLIKHDLVKKEHIRYSITMGVLLWSAFLFRRWYAYSAIAFLAVLFAFSLYERKAQLTKVVPLIGHFIVTSAVIVALVSTFQTGLVIRILETSYSDLYASYQMPLSFMLKKVYIEWLGYGLCSLMLLGIFYAVITGRRYVLFFVACSLTTLLLFSTTQQPTIQHVMPILFWVVPAIACGTLAIIRAAGRLHPYTGIAASFALSVFFAANFVITFSPAHHRPIGVIGSAISGFPVPPLHVDNFQNYLSMIDKLKQLTTEGAKFAVFASNERLSDSLVGAIDRSSRSSIAWASQVDSRDGLHLAALRARYVVVAMPFQTHLQGQKVITIPAGDINASSDWGSAYRPLESYALTAGIVATIYERTRPLSPADTTSITSKLQQYYPGWEYDAESDTIK